MTKHSEKTEPSNSTKPVCLLHNSNIQKNLYKNRIFRKLLYARKEKIYPTIICIG